MSILRIILALPFLAAIIGFSSGVKFDQSTALAATAATDNILARDAATSRNDIDLTNSCIEAGKSKTYCLCVTKIFKHKMSLRQYKAATILYQSMVSSEPTARSATKMSLKQLGYADTEITNVDNLQRNLLDETTLHNRCAVADTYFSQNLN